MMKMIRDILTNTQTGEIKSDNSSANQKIMRRSSANGLRKYTYYFQGTKVKDLRSSAIVL